MSHLQFNQIHEVIKYTRGELNSHMTKTEASAWCTLDYITAKKNICFVSIE